MQTPLVSVIIPSYNVEPYLTDSVGSVLSQTWKNVEIVIVNDGSTDGTGALAERLAADDPRVRVVHKQNGGLSSARNAGLASVAGEYISFLDADDVLLPDKIERQASFLSLFPGCDLVFSDHYIGDSKLTPILLMSKRPPLPMADVLTYRNWFAVQSPLFRASLAAAVGKFDEELTSSEDWDFWIRASGHGSFSYLPGPVAVCRSHPGQMSRNWLRMRTNIERVIRKHRQPGTEAWGNAHAMLAMLIAKRQWANGNYATMTRHLLAYAWQARSRRRRKCLSLVFRD